MNQAQIQAQIENACKRAYAEGTQDAVNKARTVMPTILANAYKQAVMDTAGFFKFLSERGESALDMEDAAHHMQLSGEIPEYEKKTPGGITTMHFAGPEGLPGALKVENAAEPWRKVEFRDDCGTLGAGYPSD